VKRRTPLRHGRYIPCLDANARVGSGRERERKKRGGEGKSGGRGGREGGGVGIREPEGGGARCSRINRTTGVGWWRGLPLRLAISNGISILDQKLLLFIKKVSHFALKIEPELANLEHFFHDHTASLFLSGGCRSASSVLGKSVGDGAGSKGGGKLDLMLGRVTATE
jgi:hypothetical protein